MAKKNKSNPGTVIASSPSGPKPAAKPTGATAGIARLKTNAEKPQPQQQPVPSPKKPAGKKKKTVEVSKVKALAKKPSNPIHVQTVKKQTNNTITTQTPPPPSKCYPLPQSPSKPTSNGVKLCSPSPPTSKPSPTSSPDTLKVTPPSSKAVSSLPVQSVSLPVAQPGMLQLASTISEHQSKFCSDTKPSIYPNSSTFHLATAKPVSISPAIESQFYESQLLLFVLEKVRGEHSKRQNYHGELDQDATELRRSFIDKLAYICDFKKGGSTVTSIAIQKTFQGFTFWIAANNTVKSEVVTFLTDILLVIKKLKNEKVVMSKKSTETLLLNKIVAFNEARLDYYWFVLHGNLVSCISRLDALIGTTNGKPTEKEIKSLRNLLAGLPKLAKDKSELVRECFDARKSSAFNTLAQLSSNGLLHSRFYDDIRHLLGRLGEHLKSVKTIVHAGLRFPALLDNFDIQIRDSPPSECIFHSPEEIDFPEIARRIFTHEDEILHYQEALSEMERKSNGTLLARLKEERCFKTRVHAELLLVDLFWWKQFDFADDDPYVGCSKPACFSCFQYILRHPGNFALPACHSKLYLAWRAPDILDENVDPAVASKIREGITAKMSSGLRAELRRQIDSRCARKPRQFDSTTRTGSSIRGPLFQDVLSTLGSAKDMSEVDSNTDDDHSIAASSDESGSTTDRHTKESPDTGGHSHTYYR